MPMFSITKFCTKLFNQDQENSVFALFFGAAGRREVKKVKRKVLGIVLALSLAFIVLATCVAPASAVTTQIEQVNAEEVCSSRALVDLVPPEEPYAITMWHSRDGSSPTPFVRRTYGPLETKLVRGPSHNSSTVYVVINSTLWSSGGSDLQNRIFRYQDDLEATGYSAYTYLLVSGSPQDIRSWFASVSDLVGCVLVGNIPAAWYQMFHDPAWDSSRYEEFPIDLFYMDLDGTWSDSWTGPWPGPPTPKTPGADGIYDGHTGNVGSEIWVGRLKADKMAVSEVSLIENYFDKNHAYRTGSLSLPQRALVYIDDDWSGGAGSVNSAVGKAYSDRTLVFNNATTNRADYVNRLSQGWSFVHLMSHGSSGGHTFKIPDPSNPSSSIWEPGGDVLGNPDVRTLDPPAFFYNLFVCSGARFTETNYLGGWYIFTQTYGLAAVGSTKTGSMQSFDEFYDPLGKGAVLGEAFKTWSLKWTEIDPNWYYGMAVLGDPTLSLSGKHKMTINTPGLDSASNIVHYTKDGVAKTGSISSGTWSDECDHGTTLSIDDLVAISPTERYFTIDAHSWAVAEPLTHTVNYYHQYKPTITTTGLPVTATATVSYVQNAISKTKTGIWDGNSFSEWCDSGSAVSITNPVNVGAGERYYSTSVTSWTVSSAFTATVKYFHQFYVTCQVTTAGVGHQDLTASNHVTVSYVQFTSGMSQDIYDGLSLSDWMDAGTTYMFENPSSGSTSTHRWFTPSPTSYTVTSSTTTSLTYYEQFLMTISSSGGLLTSTYQGTAKYVQFAISLTGHYWDGSPWSDWCDIGSTLTVSQIVLGPLNERYHTPGATSWTVTESATHSLPYHKEYKVTIKAEGLPDTLSTKVTIGTADPSPADNVAGGDVNNYELTLDSSSTPPFTWTNWVHADASLTATSLITVSASEKYVLVCWIKEGSRFAPPTVKADAAGLTYSAQYAGVKKEMSLKEANLCDQIQVTIKISNSPEGTSNDKVHVIDDLPNEFSFVYGSAKVDGSTTTPTVEAVSTPVPHQRITFEISGSGKHTITFNVKVNRACATDKNVENHVDVTFDMEDVPDVPVDVSFSAIVHPYIGATLSKGTDGPTVVPLFTKESWVFTYIVKNNYGYAMANPTLKDNFGAELIYDPNTVIANLLTDPQFSTSTGKAAQIRLLWSLPSLQAGEAFMLQVTMSTGRTPSKLAQQEYTSPGVKVLNSGATLKWLDASGKQRSLETGTISVTAVDQIYGHVTDQHGVGVAEATVELYYGGKLIMTVQTDSSGLYNFADQLKKSGTYTVKIKSLPSGYMLGPNPSEKTATYNAGQTSPKMVNFTVQKI